MNQETNNDSQMPDLIEGIRQNAKMAVISGIMLIIAGFIAISSPFYAGLSMTIMLGALLAVGGISQCFLAFQAGAFGRGLMILLVGLLTAVAGFYLMSQPVAGLAAITLFLVAYFVAAGICELIMAFQARPADGWGWILFNGIVTLLLGILLWRQFPLSGAWAVGVLFGIKMIFGGWALVFIGRSVKSVTADQAA